MNYNNLSLDTALSREFSKMGMTVKGLKSLSYLSVLDIKVKVEIVQDVISTCEVTKVRTVSLSYGNLHCAACFWLCVCVCVCVEAVCVSYSMSYCVQWFIVCTCVYVAHVALTGHDKTHKGRWACWPHSHTSLPVQRETDRETVIYNPCRASGKLTSKCLSLSLSLSLWVMDSGQRGRWAEKWPIAREHR